MHELSDSLQTPTLGTCRGAWALGRDTKQRASSLVGSRYPVRKPMNDGGMGRTHEDVPAIRKHTVRYEPNRMAPHALVQHTNPRLIVARPLRPPRAVAHSAEQVEEAEVGVLAVAFGHLRASASSKRNADSDG